MSLSRRRGSFLARPKESADQSIEPARSPEQKRRRNINLFDAVAGRASNHGFRSAFPSTSKRSDYSVRQAAFPQEILMRTNNCPFTSPDDPYYFADRSLYPDRNPDQRLPDTQIVKGVHGYAADFYARAIPHGDGAINEKSMDESALLAFGILLEEAAMHILGETGDMALVEGQEQFDDVTKEERAVNVLPLQTERSVKAPPSAQRYGVGRERKKRKIGHETMPFRDTGGGELGRK